MDEHGLLLTSVEVVARSKRSILSCRDTWLRIEEFIDGTERWSNMKATSFIPAHTEAYALDKAMQVAAARGYLHMIRWLHGYFPTRSFRHVKASANVMDFAAMYGRTNVVHFLHLHRTEGCTVKAMDAAATNGHLGVVMYLHAHRTEGCTTNAMDGAATNGHLGVVKYLHTSRTEGCTVTAMDGAASNGHFAVVKYLRRSRTEGCSSDAFDGAAVSENLKMLRFLRKHYRRVGGVTAEGITSTINTRKLFLKWWLRWHYKDAFVVFYDDGEVRVSFDQ